MAYIICFLPLPIVMAMVFCVLYFTPAPALITAFQNHAAVRAVKSALPFVFSAIFFVLYLLFGALSMQGIAIAYRLRHGEARYVENYKAGIQRRMDRLKKKLALRKNLQK